MSETKPYFSVILPVYNGSQTMSRALVSILAQTFSDYELLVIENASDDNSLDIAKAYEKSFDKVRVFHSQIKGVSRARNVGLDNALGEYVVFLDADDFYMPNALKLMHSVIRDEDPDILIAAFTNYASSESDRRVRTNGRDLYLAMLDPVRYYSRIVDSSEVNEFLLRHQCAKAYRRKMLRDARVRFNEDCPMYVDLIFNEAAYSACNKAVLIFKKLYQYNSVPGSIVNRTGPAFIKDAETAFGALVSQLDPLDAESRDAVLFSAFMVIMRMLQVHADDPSEDSFAMLDCFLSSAEARRVVTSIGERELHTIPAVDGLLHAILAKLIMNDTVGALSLLRDAKKPPEGKNDE